MGYSDRTRCLRRFRLGTDTSVLAEESESLPIGLIGVKSQWGYTRF